MTDYLTRSGLAVVEYANDEDSIQRQLKDHDRDLVLDKEFDETFQAWAWFVVKKLGSDRPAVRVFSWRDEYLVPLPLSSRLVDELKNLDANSRAPRNNDVLAINDKLMAERRAEVNEEIDWYANELTQRLQGKKLHLLPRRRWRSRQ